MRINLVLFFGIAFLVLFHRKGIKPGKQISFSKRLGREGRLVLEVHNLKQAGAAFIGASYGITIFSNIHYTGYGRD